MRQTVEWIDPNERLPNREECERGLIGVYAIPDTIVEAILKSMPSSSPNRYCIEQVEFEDGWWSQTFGETVVIEVVAWMPMPKYEPQKVSDEL